MIGLRLLMPFLVAFAAATAGRETVFGQEVANPFGVPAPPAHSDTAAGGALIGMPNPFSAETKLPSVESLEVPWDAASDIAFDDAITLGEMSVLAYNDEHTRRLVLRLLGFKEIVLLDNGPMSGFIAIKGDLAVIAFRGTNINSPADWLANIDLFRQTPMHGSCKFHQGFQRSYHRFSDTVRQTISARSLKTVWITGHSLGGAMAVCCAYDLNMHGLPVTGLVTFGQPRVANPAMAVYLENKFANRYLRFVNFDDIVPHVPTTKPAVLSDYRHAGELAWFRESGIERNKYLMKAGPSEPFGADPQEVESEISEEELVELQRQLKVREAPSTSLSLPPSLLPSEPVIYLGRDTGTFLGSPPNVLAFGDDAGQAQITMPAKAAGFSSRFSDHSMLEYVRKLNEFAVFEER